MGDLCILVTSGSCWNIFLSAFFGWMTGDLCATVGIFYSNLKIQFLLMKIPEKLRTRAFMQEVDKYIVPTSTSRDFCNFGKRHEDKLK